MGKNDEISFVAKKIHGQEEEHLKKIKERAQEKVEKRRAEGRLSYREELKLRDYHQWGTTEFYEHVLMPQSSEEIQKELKSGPPKGLSMREKKVWRSYRRNRLEMAVCRESFFVASREITDRAEEEIHKVKESKITPFYQTFCRLEKEVSFEGNQLLKRKEASESGEKVENIGRNQELFSMILGLNQLIKDLAGLDSGEAAENQVKNLMENYREIEQQIFPVKFLSEKRMKDMEIMGDCHIARIFLTYGAASLLTHCTEQLPVNQVHAMELAKLKGLSNSYGMLASKIEMTGEYKEKLEKSTAIYEKILIEQEQQQRETEEKTVIIMELVQNLLKDSIYSEPIKEALEKEIKNRYKAKLGKGDFEKEDFFREVKERLTVFSANWKELGKKLEGCLKEKLGFNTPGIQAGLLENIAVLHRSALLDGVSETDKKEYINQALKTGKAKLQELQERRDYLTKNGELPCLSRIPSGILLGMEKIAEIILKENTREEFKRQVHLLEEQVDYTLTLVDDFLTDKFSPLSQKIVFEHLLLHNPVDLVFGSFTRLWNLMEYYTEKVIPQDHPRVKETEEQLLTIMSKLEIKKEWKTYVYRNLTKEDRIGEAEEKLIKLKERLVNNQQVFDRTMATYEFPRGKWASLLEWKKESLDKGTEEFQEKMKEELEKEDFVRRSLISLEEYLEEEKEEAKEIDVSENYSNKSLLKYNLLCHWPGFGDALYNLEDEVMDALNMLLKKGSLKAKFSFLENINNLDDLESLTFTELQFMAKELCLNMSKGIAGWSLLVGTEADEIWKAMIPEMMLGTLEEGKAANRAEELGVRLRGDRRIRQYRVLHALRTDPTKDTGILRYHHKDTTTASNSLGKGARVEQRRKRFQLAADIWKILKENNMVDEAIEIIRKKGSKTGSGAAIHKEIGNLMRKLSLTKKMTEEMRKLCDNVEADIIKADEYVNEFRLCEMEGFLLDKNYDKDAYSTFTAAGKKEGYKELLREKGELVTLRILQIDRVIEEAYRERGYKPRRDKILLQLGPFIAGVKEGEEEENLRRFGVANWEEVLQILSAEFRLRVGLASTTAKIIETRHIQFGNSLKERRAYLEQYKQGILQPIIPLLLQDEEIWKSTLVDENKTYLQKIEERYQKLKEPLRLLRERFCYGEEFVRQLVEDLGQEILYTEKNSLQWKETFQEYFDEFCEHKVAGYSITKELKKLEAENPKMAGYLTEMLLTHPQGLELITDKEKFKNTLAQCKKYVEPNTKAVDAFLKNLSPVPAEGEETGFRLYAREAVLSSEPEDFLKQLSGLWQKFQKLQEKTKQQALESAKAMEQKANIFREFEERRQAAKKVEEQDIEKIYQLKNLMQSASSPLLAAMGAKKLPGVKELEKAAQRIASYAPMSKTAENWLLEVWLTPMEEKKIQQHLQWFQGMEEKVGSIEFAKGEKLKEGSLGSFLTFLYIRHQKDISGDKLLSKEEIIREFHVMGQRLSKMKDLSNRTMDQNALQRKSDSLDQLQENKLLMSKRRMITEAASMGLFLLKEEEFDDLVTRQSRYLENARLADQMFRKLLEEEQKIKGDRQLLRIGLAEYFHKEILEGVSLQEIRIQAERLLADKDCYQALTATVRMKQSYAEGKALMEGISSTGLEEGEQKLSHTVTRESLESFLAQKHNEKFRKSYNRLDRDQRKVFALVVLQLEKNSRLPSMKFIRSDEMEETRQVYTASCLERYETGKDFHPEIFYDRVLDILCRPDGRMKEELFYHAMERTMVYVQKRRDAMPKELSRLMDAKSSIQSASAYVKEAAKPVEQVANMSEWKKVLLSYDIKAGDRVQAIKERFDKLDKYHLPLLIAVLQERTILDKSSRAVTEGEQEYVNQKERELTVKQLQQGKGPAIVSQTINQALLTLRSYQLRDDIELINQKLSKKDFAQGALERKTAIDWQLLDRAMDFIKTIE